MKLNESSPPLAQKLLFYSIGAGAASLTATGQAAPADVVSYGSGLSGNTIYFSLLNTAAPSTSSATNQQFELSSSPSKTKASVNDANSSNYQVAYTSRSGQFGAANYALKLGTGATIGAGLFSFTNGGTINNYYAGNTANGTPPGTRNGDWKVANGPTRGFLGFQIVVAPPADAANAVGTHAPTQTYYGFADLTVNNLNGNTPGVYTLNGFAYDPTGASIITFAIPEPGSTTALLVAGGAAGIAAVRRRRQGATSAL